MKYNYTGEINKVIMGISPKDLHKILSSESDTPAAPFTSQELARIEDLMRQLDEVIEELFFEENNNNLGG